MDYLALVNKVIEEGSSEMNPLTLATWSSADAGRRQYPRFKRAVADAWKEIQIERGQWEFNVIEFFGLVFPRMKVENLIGMPLAGDVYRGVDSEARLLIRDMPFVDQIEFEIVQGTTRMPRQSERFTTLDGLKSFDYLEQGEYDFKAEVPNFAEIDYNSMTVKQLDPPTLAPVSCIHIPFANYQYQQISYTGNSVTPPTYFAETPDGRIVFFPQSVKPFQVSFYYQLTPQILTEPTDIPLSLPSHYHEWIAWRALASVAEYDKNPDLFSYANRRALFYKRRAELNLMPKLKWGDSRFNYE